MNAPVPASGDAGVRRFGSVVSVRAPVFVALLALTGAFAYFNLFSIFTNYDDEGYFLRAVQHFVDGHPLYEDLHTPYGPVYFLFQWVIHVPFGLPITNDAVRFSSLFFWLLTSSLCTLIVRATTRSTTLAALTFLATFLHLRAIPREPGHPQELIGVLLAAVMLLPTFPALMTNRGRAAMASALGAITAMLLLIKINVGFFLGVSLFLAMSAALPPGRLRGFVRIAAAGTALTLPSALMFGGAPPHPDCRLSVACYAVLATSTTLSVILVAWFPGPRPWEGWIRPRDVACAAIVFAATLAAVLGIVFATGTTPSGMFESTILLARRLPSQFCYGVSVHWLSPVWACALSATAIAYLIRWRRQAAGDSDADAGLATFVALMKVGFGCLAVFITANSFYGPLRLMMFASPMVWLVLIPAVPAGGSAAATGQLARLIMATVAAVEILQAYPVAGSQTAFASLAAVPAAMTCLADGFAWFRVGAGSHVHLVARPRRWPALAKAVLMAYAVGYTVYGLRGQYVQYSQEVPLGLPGAELVRLPEARATAYRELATTLGSSADSFIATTGMNSLHLWSGVPPPDRTLLGSELNCFTEDQQLDIVAGLMKHARPMVVEDTVNMPNETKPMMREINRQFRPWRRAGQFMLLVPNDAPDPEQHGKVGK